MKLNYDAATDSLYIHLAERPSVDSDEVVDGVVLDFDATGALVGIDVQHASQRADIRQLAINHNATDSSRSGLTTKGVGAEQRSVMRWAANCPAR